MTAPLAALVRSLAVLGAFAMALSGPAVAGPVPDTVQMALLQQAVVEVRLVRLQGDFGTRWGRRPSFDSSGVRLGEELEGPGNSMRPSGRAAESAPIPWREISSIETDRGTAGTSIMMGLAIGLCVGTVLALSSIDVFSLKNQQHQGDKILALSVGGGLALGALVGFHGQKRTIYPPSPVRHP